ncbi:MAG: hypothetical protein ACI9W2_004300 [Gammaproteobacteria bacterium]|jgi:hypothetical protein
MIVDCENYVLEWREPAERWFARCNERVPPKLPFLIDRTLPLGRKAEPRALLAGVLYAWPELFRATLAEERDARFRFVQWLFEAYRRQRVKHSQEELVVALAQQARVRHGPMVSARMLFAGRLLRDQTPAVSPEHASREITDAPRGAIEVALIYDVWRLIEYADHIDVESACETIVDAFARRGDVVIGEDVAQGLDYAYCLALHLLARHEAMREYFWKHASQRVTTPALRERLIRALNDDTLTRDSLRLSDGGGAGNAMVAGVQAQ